MQWDKSVYVFVLQTKTDAAAFAVRVRASHKLETLTGSRTKDQGRRTSWEQGTGRSWKMGSMGMTNDEQRVRPLCEISHLVSTRSFGKGENNRMDLRAHKDEHLHTAYILP
ncbi:uncharacterized protein LOC122616998 [Drosophila teissieri]|uniref:uncharacterized protein LOC122616998 n=1 Tax=Drosophila teissieri TaxID=7243 RepID=UPI001CBA0344|nr:uncharacterized protein LOC122616998 [Drosophila teissieri]